VIFSDGDLERAAAATPGGVFANAGQDCCARSRVLVERPVFDRYLSLLADALPGWTVGDPTDRHQDGSAGHGRAPSDGRELPGPGMGDPGGGPVEAFAVGAVPDGPGYWFPPTVIAPAEPGWRLAARRSSGRSWP